MRFNQKDLFCSQVLITFYGLGVKKNVFIAHLPYFFSDYISCRCCFQNLLKMNSDEIVQHCKSCSSMTRYDFDHTYICIICELFHTSNSQYMKRHIRKHTGDKPFECTYCDYRASRKDNLWVHIKMRHMTA